MKNIRPFNDLHGDEMHLTPDLDYQLSGGSPVDSLVDALQDGCEVMVI